MILSSFAVSNSVQAIEDRANFVEEIVVYGRAQQHIGTAATASEGLVGYADIQLPPLLRVGELVEAVPGAVATQHSGTGKANQYFLRGFNLDHGTDFAAHVDGVPINMRSHGHGQGYLDLNFLIPELVATATYSKGPYRAASGDFASAGSVDFALYERLPESTVQATFGEDGYARGLLAGNVDVAGGDWLGALDVTAYDGPWAMEENLEQFKLYSSYVFKLGGGEARVALQGYDSQWNATDQIPTRAVAAGLIDELGFIDPDLGGETQRYALSADFKASNWHTGAYLLQYDFALFSDFTYQLEDPVLGDEFEQRDSRRVAGIWTKSQRTLGFSGRPLNLVWGGNLRFDDIDEVGLYRTAARLRTGAIRQDQVEERSASLYGEVEWAVNERLRTSAGLRGDFYDWQVTALQAPNSGEGDEALLSPKLGAAMRVADSLEGYLNWGRGLHSNDVRGATISVDPVSEEPVEAVDVLVRSEGAEAGLRYERGRNFNATVLGFWLELDSELVYVGDAGTTEPNAASERAGLEATAFWQVHERLALNAAYTYTDAQFKYDQGAGVEIPGAVEQTFTLGVNATWENGFSASARARYLGSAPLLEDGSVRSDSSWLLNAGGAYRRGPLEFRLDVFNLLDSDAADISYFYASRLDGEPEGGVEDIHFHPLEPRTVRASVAWHWGD